MDFFVTLKVQENRTRNAQNVSYSFIFQAINHKKQPDPGESPAVIMIQQFVVLLIFE